MVTGAYIAGKKSGSVHSTYSCDFDDIVQLDSVPNMYSHTMHQTAYKAILCKSGKGYKVDIRLSHPRLVD